MSSLKRSRNRGNLKLERPNSPQKSAPVVFFTIMVMPLVYHMATRVMSCTGGSEEFLCLHKAERVMNLCSYTLHFPAHLLFSYISSNVRNFIKWNCAFS